MVNPTPLETDYLIIGGGAVALAFADTLLQETDAQIIIVDRHHRPGGHWNDAYSFVRLHQASAYYGVNSRELSRCTKDATGLNQGLYGLASGGEVLDYFDRILRERFLPSRRVRWFPMCDYREGPAGTHRFTSLTTGECHQVVVRRKVVDGTHSRTAVPSTHPPRYAVAPGVECIPLNGLPAIRRAYAGYTVVGAGKTGMDACQWLLENGVAPGNVRWIMPRDAWLLDRANMQPGPENFEHAAGLLISQFDIIAAASSVPDLFIRLEAGGHLMRLDEAVTPTAYHCATLSRAEWAQLRTLRDVVRLGRVRSIDPERIVLERGTVPADPDTLYVDCSATAIQRQPPLPVFDGNRINLLMVRLCQPLFSAAFIAYLESRVADPAEGNALCLQVPIPDEPMDWLRMLRTTLANSQRWQQDEGIRAWLSQCRLNTTTLMLRGVDLGDPANQALIQEARAKAPGALANLTALLGETP